MSESKEIFEEFDLKDKGLFCSWSGGKDSCLALYRAIREGGRPRFLVSMLEENGEVSRGHKLPVEVIKRQALSLGIPLVARATSWEGYESTLLSVLEELKEVGVKDGVFGDIYLEEHREWLSRVCSIAGVAPHLPLWGIKTGDLLEELFGNGFVSTIVAVKDGVLDQRFLGRNLDRDLSMEFSELGIDVCGEAGEYHTVVTDGPVFSTPLNLKAGEKVLGERYWQMSVTL